MLVSVCRGGVTVVVVVVVSVLVGVAWGRGWEVVFAHCCGAGVGGHAGAGGVPAEGSAGEGAAVSNSAHAVTSSVQMGRVRFIGSAGVCCGLPQPRLRSRLRQGL